MLIGLEGVGHFYGQIQQVRLYDVALSAAEVQEICGGDRATKLQMERC